MKRWVKRALIVLLSLTVLLVGGFYVYAMDYDHADAEAVAAFSQGGASVRTAGYLTSILPAEPNGDGLIFTRAAR